MTQTIDIQALQPQGHTRAELCWRLSRVRKKRVPEPTLTRWLTELGMEPNEYDLYDDSDLAILTSLVIFLKRCRSISKFKQLLIKEIESNAS
jgi:hypothetical protein